MGYVGRNPRRKAPKTTRGGDISFSYRDYNRFIWFVVKFNEFPRQSMGIGIFQSIKVHGGNPKPFVFHEVYGCFSLFSYVFMAHVLSNMSCLFIPKQGEKRVAQPPPTLFIQMP